MSWTLIYQDDRRIIEYDGAHMLRIAVAGQSVSVNLAEYPLGILSPVPDSAAAKLRAAGIDPGQARVCGRVVLPLGPATEAVEAAWQTWRNAADARDRQATAALHAAIPGLAELRAASGAARIEEDRYHSQFARMMEDEYNDGARPPPPIDQGICERAKSLAAEYPRAALYLRAEGQAEHSAHYRKAAAGREAMEIIHRGGELAEAERVMRDWVPAEALWD